jgi:hypothetical protein
MQWILGALAAVLGLLLWPSDSVMAQGTAFTLSCNNDEVLAGIQGRQGWWMDGIAARCRKINTNGDLASSVRTTAYRGGNGGTQRTFDCTRNEVMVGYSASAGDNGYVLHVHEIICAPWNSTTRTAGSPTRSLKAFDKKSGSGRFIAGSCFQGQVGSGLRGRAGVYLDRLSGIDCRYAPGAVQPTPPSTPRPTTPPPTITSAPVPIGPSGSYNVSLCAEPPNPQFSWQAVPHATSYIVEYRNDTLNRVTTSNAMGTKTNPPRFREGHQYRWRVRASNSQGQGPWSSYLSFTGVKGPTSNGPCVILTQYPLF